ncbi:MAG: arginine--tRNA ligase [Candidatus Eisenbacteria bacterium]|nr:arginine--tRNA ligase [Candidatus Eisenbacteria bacterium]
MNIEREINEALREYLRKNPIPDGHALPEARLERPRLPEHGDLSSSIALALASVIKKNPLDIAQAIASELKSGASSIEKIEVTPPGFINFFYKKEVLVQSLKEILARKEEYGTSKIGGGKRVQVEFVSANPVGPLNVVNGRAAAVGDAVARLLGAAGFDVSKEYYVNDAGTQVEILGKSLASRWSALSGQVIYPFPEDGYKGQYVVELAEKLDSERRLDWLNALKASSGPDRIALIEKSTGKFRDYALSEMIETQRRELDEYNVVFDVWFRESSLRSEGALEQTLADLRTRNFVVERDGALWFKMEGSMEGSVEEKERVLVRSSGEPTYFLGDLSYHKNKYDRGFEKVIDIWGPDHHGHIPRMMAGALGLAIPRGWLEIMTVQMVRLVSEGKVVKMSKRAGEFITLKDLITEVGRDAARYFFLMRRTSSHLDFDIDLAKKTSAENPVYYVQYAHARARNVAAFAREKGAYPEATSIDFSFLGNQDETRVMKLLAIFPEVIKGSAIAREPHRVTDYLHELCQSFHQFYQRNRIVGEKKEIEGARIALVEAVSIVLRNGLGVLGVSAPEKM